MLNTKEAINIIKEHKTVAVVGLSPKTDRPSYKVGNFLMEKDFDVIPVNPGPFKEILNRPNFRSLADLPPGSVDWIDLFVNPTRLMALLDDIIKISPKLVWCQIGVVNKEFNQALEKSGIPYIANVCPKIEWKE